MKDDRYEEERFRKRETRHMRLVDTFITFKIVGVIVRICIVLFILFILFASAGAA